MFGRKEMQKKILVLTEESLAGLVRAATCDRCGFFSEVIVLPTDEEGVYCYDCYAAKDESEQDDKAKVYRFSDEMLEAAKEAGFISDVKEFVQ